MKTVLVFPCGSEIGLEIYKSLHASTHFNIIGASSADDHGKFVYQSHISGVPYIDDENFVTAINEIVRTNNVDYIFPAHDSAVLKLAQEKAKGNLACDVITSPVGTCEIARSKRKTYETLEGIIPTPKTYDYANGSLAEHLPVFLKPDVGQGSRGTYKAETVEDVNFYTQKDSSLLALEYLPGKEYTIDCFTDKYGTLLFSEGRERKRVANGISVNSASVKDPRFLELARKINKTLAFRGVWFFQVKESAAGELVLMEIAPRIAGTMGLVRCKGVNLALLSLFDAMGYDIDIFENDYEMVIDRALQNSYKHHINYGHVYLDFDDLVVINGQVSPMVMAFVYQCINKDVKIHLLTKHKNDLSKTLQQYRLEGVFDEIIWIKDETEKPAHIIEKDAIFIDDSFAERKAVFDSCGIPVFDAHMIESLMEG